MTRSTAPTSDGVDDFDAIIDSLFGGSGDPGRGATAPVPVRATPPVATPMTAQPFGRNTAAISTEVKGLVNEIRRDAGKQSGVMAWIKTQVRGDELQAKQLATLHRRIDAVNVTEETKVVLYLALAVRVIVFRNMLEAAEEMRREVAGYVPGTEPHELGLRLLERNMAYFEQLYETATAAGINQALRASNLDR